MRTGKSIDVLRGLGINNNYTTSNRHENDYYATPPEAVEWLLKYETFNRNIWEPMCGGGHISETLKQHGYEVTSTDLHNYGYEDTVIRDFTKCTKPFDGDIISNPPYKDSIPMTLKALELTGRKVAFLMKIQFLETVKRHQQIFKEHPPARIYIFTKRIRCWKNGVDDNSGSAVCYCWIIWEKNNIYEPIIRWIPNYETVKEKVING